MKRTRLKNEITGKFLRWCYGPVGCNHYVNEWLAIADAMADGFGKGWDNYPHEILKAVLQRIDELSSPLRIELARREKKPLTEAERSYCELEGIKPADFHRA